MVEKRPKCLSCSKHLSPWGKTTSGRKRYGCNYCHKTRRYQQKVKKTDIFQLFKQYVLWGNTYEMLSSLSGYSVRYLEKKFHVYFLMEPSYLPGLDQSGLEETFLLIDGLWFGRWFVYFYNKEKLADRKKRGLNLQHISSIKPFLRIIPPHGK